MSDEIKKEDEKAPKPVGKVGPLKTTPEATTPTIGQGTTLGYGAGTGTGGMTPPTSWTLVAKIKAMTPMNITVGDAETTTFDDTADTYIPALINGGEYEVEVYHIPANTTTLYGLLRTVQWFKITLSSGGAWTFQGYINGYQPATPMKTANTEKIKVKVTGQPTFA